MPANLRHAAIPAPMAFFERLLVAPDGTIWLAPHYPFRQGEDQAWRPSLPTASGSAPSRSRPASEVHAVTDDHLPGVWRDEVDVEHGRRHRIRK
jgi:hypothetical protein